MDYPECLGGKTRLGMGTGVVRMGARLTLTADPRKVRSQKLLGQLDGVVNPKQNHTHSHHR